MKLMKLIDLSLTIQPHWRWAIEQKQTLAHSAADPYQVTIISLSVHAFTHVDTPLHIAPDKITIDKVPLEHLAGPAALLDLTYVQANQEIDRSDLERVGGHIQKGDIVLLKTAWDQKRNPKSRHYWSEAPYVGEEAAIWLAKQPIKAVGFDFPQDYVIREIPPRHPPPEEMPTHHHILGKGIYLVEYLCNLHQIKRERITFFAVPLKVRNAEGAPTRALAMLDE
jgi:kynurenine formamidase